MQVIDFSNPNSPAIIATTPDALGGKLQDLTVLNFFGTTLTFGADVYFVGSEREFDEGCTLGGFPDLLKFDELEVVDGNSLGLEQ